MTLREVVDLSLLAKSVPDEKTTKNNMEFLQNAAQKMEKADQAKGQQPVQQQPAQQPAQQAAPAPQGGQ